MAKTYTIIDGSKFAPAVAADFKKLAAAFKKATGYNLLATEASRTGERQQALWDLYFYPNGTVRPASQRPSWLGRPAPRGSSKHETDRAVDVRDSGRDAGVTVAGTTRSKWLRDNARKYNFVAAGLGFNEPWHIEWTGKDPWFKAATAAVKKAVKKVVAKVIYPKVTVANLAKIGDVRGLQKIARLHGYTGRIDNIWGAGSRAGFTRFLKASGYKSPADWLRKRWGYTGDDRLGPVMKAALKRANDANYKALK